MNLGTGYSENWTLLLKPQPGERARSGAGLRAPAEEEGARCSSWAVWECSPMESPAPPHRGHFPLDLALTCVWDRAVPSCCRKVLGAMASIRAGRRTESVQKVLGAMASISAGHRTESVPAL